MVFPKDQQEMVDAALAHFIRVDGCDPGAGQDSCRALHLYVVLIGG